MAGVKPKVRTCYAESLVERNRQSHVIPGRVACMMTHRKVGGEETGFQAL